MPPETPSHIVGVECRNPGCRSFFVTPRQLPPELYGQLREAAYRYRCPHCSTTGRYSKRDHIFLLLDQAA